MANFQNEVAPNRDDRHQGRLAYAGEFLDDEVAGEVWEKAAESSLVLRLGRQVPVGYGETVIPVNTVQPEVGQVGVGTSSAQREGYRKPVSGVAWESQAFSPIKLATIVTASSEFVRANPKGLWSRLAPQLAEAIGRGIDLAVFHGKRPDTGDALLGVANNGWLNQADSVSFDGVGADPLDELFTQLWAAAVNYGVDPNAIALDPLMAPVLVGARDSEGNRIFQNSFNLSATEQRSIAGLKVETGKAVSGRVGRATDSNTRAILGDWSRCLYGYADPVSVKITDSATIRDAYGEPVDLWQTNQVAIMIETTFGWKVDPDAFGRLVTESGVGSAGQAPAGEQGGNALVTDYDES